ncbi:nuclear transport factor 2 family protein [Streptomyces sp. Ag109_O5-10]|uniref:nuclear transport factor 2 family protein n=1 Tax=Streptomyces sp. Ag109_O5-10 TaxID=1855349 RepID=UPI00089B15D8|nr:nuclear transport factor 2 family protein [Streptomyces sp. Ag109_O5-10]SEF16355.1 SnoaL-like domain-containing protein [Streptomyces sp. Ag109_O5-10]
MSHDHDTVLAAADALISAFAEGRTDDYFAAFAPDATFVFHTTGRRLDSTAEYRALWQQWTDEDAFRVLACDSSDRRLQLLGDTAVFTHSVTTRISTTAGEDVLHERETIVLHRTDGDAWQAVHEHLSAATV